MMVMWRVVVGRGYPVLNIAESVRTEFGFGESYMSAAKAS